MNNYVLGIHSNGIDSRRLAVAEEYDVDSDALNRAIYIAERWPKLPSHVRETIVSLIHQFSQ